MRHVNRRPGNLRRRQRGVSLIELMIGITLGLLLMTALVSLYVANSASRAEFVKSTEQIENGRYALDLIRRDAELAGFFGTGGIARGKTPVEPAPCETTPAALGFGNATDVNIPLAVRGYAAGVAAPCLPGLSATSEMLVVRRVSTTAVTAALPGVPYMQVSYCPQDSKDFVFDASAPAFTMRTRECDAAKPAPLREAVVRIFYIASCDNCANGGDAVPTLKMAELVNGAFQARSLSRGIEDMHIVYGMDLDGNGSADCYVDDPGIDNSAACAASASAGYAWSSSTALTNWSNVTTLRVSVLARTLQPSSGPLDAKRTYDLGRASASGPFNDRYKRRVYAQVARLVNVAGLREQ